MKNQNLWEIQQASIEDANELAVFAAKAFRDAFGAMNAASDVEAYCAHAFTPEAQGRELSDGKMTTLVVRGRGGILGYAQIQEAKPHVGVRDLPAVLLKRIYVDQKWLGRGVGKSLMKAVAAEAVNRGARTLWLTVWERNPRAIHFYTRLGMETVGDDDFLLGSDLQRDLVMAGSVDTIIASLSTPEASGTAD
ncbi:MAG TPA: GNAT family N-acetyltransferase [Gemmatimonadaceae bacterium]